MNDYLTIKWVDGERQTIGKITDIKSGEKYITIKYSNDDIFKGELVLEIDKIESITFRSKE